MRDTISDGTAIRTQTPVGSDSIGDAGVGRTRWEHDRCLGYGVGQRGGTLARNATFHVGIIELPLDDEPVCVEPAVQSAACVAIHVVDLLGRTGAQRV